jgi:hypothetical protein
MAPEERYTITQRLAQPCGITLYSATDRLEDRKRWMWRLYEFDGEQHHIPTQASVAALAAPLIAFKHAGSVSTVDAYVDEEGLVAAMEIPNGEPLDLFAAKFRLDERCLAQIGIPCIEALIAMHAAGLSHGSLEPGVIFCDVMADGTVTAQLIGCGLIHLTYSTQGDPVVVPLEEDLHHLGRSLYIGMGGPSMRDAAVMKPIQPSRPDLAPAACEWIMSLVHPDASKRLRNPALALQQLRQLLQPPAQATQITEPVAWQPVVSTATQSVPARSTSSVPSTGYVLTPAASPAPAVLAVAAAAPRVEMGMLTTPLVASSEPEDAVSERETTRLVPSPKTAPMTSTATPLRAIYSTTQPTAPITSLTAAEASTPSSSRWDTVSWRLIVGTAIVAGLALYYMTMLLSPK